MTISPLERYRQALSQDDILPDDSQLNAVQSLDALWQQLVERDLRARRTWLLSFRDWAKGRVQAPIKGLYFWGGVGRGKTWLMDMFFEALPVEQKMRTHFHRFMRRVHTELKALQKTKNPLETVADVIAAEAKVLCFDEFFVADITDAMILANLLDALFRRKVILVATSNVPPVDLYRDGLQRERFLPAIELLQMNTHIVNVDGGTDYRLRALEQAELYYSPLTDQAREAIAQCFKRLVPEEAAICVNVELEVEGRIIRAKKEAEDVVWFTFASLCGGPRSQNDYIELAREYHAVLLENVPVFRGDNDDEARRFINLVDEFYDRGVKLILSAEAPILNLYQGTKLQFEFARTASRIQEMQSTEYLSCQHKA